MNGSDCDPIYNSQLVQFQLELIRISMSDLWNAKLFTRKWKYIRENKSQCMTKNSCGSYFSDHMRVLRSYGTHSEFTMVVNINDVRNKADPNYCMIMISGGGCCPLISKVEVKHALESLRNFYKLYSTALELRFERIFTDQAGDFQ